VGALPLTGQGASFVAAGAAFVVDIVVSVLVSLVTAPKPARELAGLVYSETPVEQRTDPEASSLPWYRSPTKLAGISLVMVVALNLIFR
jgi:SSS family solute:Na+ symporter